MRPTINRPIVLLLCAMLLAACSARAAERKPFVDYWMAIRVGSVQIGCMHTTIVWNVVDGKKGLQATERVWLKAKNEADSVRIDAEHSVLAGTDMAPKIERVSMCASVSGTSAATPKMPELTAEYIYGRDTITSIITRNGKKKEETEPLPEKFDYSRYLGGRKIAVGDEIRLPILSLFGTGPVNSTKLSFNLFGSYRAVSRESLTINGVAYEAFLLTRKGSTTTMWATADCQLLKTEDSGSDYTMLRQSEADALAWLDSSGPDVSQVPVDRPIADYLHAKEVKVRLLGICDKGLVLSDDRQQAIYLPEKRAAEYTITAKAFDPAKSLALPVGGPEARKWRGATKGIESKDASIVTLASQIIGGETNAYRAAGKLRAWVHSNMTYSPNDSRAPCSAVEILKTRRGVCAHYAILYAALARAARIPTKVVVGLCYGTWNGTGNFHFHAWAESYVGEWVAVDPTWGDEVVDATHIKIIEGGAETASDYRGAVGRLTAEVISPVLPPATGREHVILAAANILIVRWPDEDLQWFCDPKDMPTDAPAIASGSLVITLPNGDQWIVPPGYKMDTPEIPNLVYIRENNPDTIIIAMPDGSTHAFPGASKLETHTPPAGGASEPIPPKPGA